MLDGAVKGFALWRNTNFLKRAKLMNKAADILESCAQEFARIMAQEMGKPINEGAAEVKKCAWVCRYYAENAAGFLENQKAKTDASESFVSYEPLGAVLAIMPWNYPFWQVFRFAVPSIMAGNVAILKHASNVPESALAIESVFANAGFPEYVFRSLLISGKTAEELISDNRIAAVTLTGSNAAGIKVGGAAGAAIKPCVLELGGSDAFIVLEDADVKQAAKTGVQARMLNSGQSCIAAKRFIIHEKIYDKFIKEFLDNMKALKMGDPTDQKTNTGPQAREDLRDELAAQVENSVKKGAKILLGGKVPKRKGAWYPPTILTDVKKGMPAADEEMFGPVAAIIKVSGEEEALKTANESEFGLGASLWTNSKTRAKKIIPQIEAGAVFVNGLVKSDPRLPFGGIKKSGFGRELAREGILEFVNTKTVWIK